MYSEITVETVMLRPRGGGGGQKIWFLICFVSQGEEVEQDAKIRKWAKISEERVHFCP